MKKTIKVGDELELIKYANGNFGQIEKSTFHVGQDTEIYFFEVKEIKKVQATLESK